MAKAVTRVPRPLGRSLLLFLLLFAVLIFPWPGFDQAYGSYFRGFGTFFLGRDGPGEFLRFDPYMLVHDFTTLNTQITLGNEERASPDGHFPAAQTSLDTRSIGWVPTALTIALIGASPVPWRRKVGALIAGVVLVHLLILFTLESWIWSQSSGLGLAHLSPFAQSVADGLSYTFVNQMGVSFSAPVVIWLLTTFRREDAARLFGRPGRPSRRGTSRATDRGS